MKTDARKYYLKGASEVAEKTLKEVDVSFIKLSELIGKFSFSWVDSLEIGPDAVMISRKLKDRIDIKLLKTGKLDFEQLRRIMIRMNRANDALYGLSRIDTYLSYYKSLCKEKGLKQQVGHVETFYTGLLERVKETIEWDTKRFAGQISRCNLYHQNVLKSRTFKVAFASLLISASALFLAILSIVLPNILRLLN